MLSVRNWGYKPHPEFSAATTERPSVISPYFGFELEVELTEPKRELLADCLRKDKLRMTGPPQTPGKTYAYFRENGVPLNHGRAQYSWGMIQEAEETINKLNIYVKADGSLQDGVELVTHPCTLAGWKERYPLIKKLCKELVSLGFTSYKGNTCGFHIHINRESFLSKLHEWKFTTFIHANPAFFLAYSNRTDLKKVLAYSTFLANTEALHASFLSHYYLEYQVGGYPLEHYRKDPHHEAVSITTYTLESRFFRGTLNPESILGNIELIDALQKYTQEHSFLTMSVPHFVEWLIGNQKRWPITSAKTKKALNRAKKTKPHKIKKICSALTKYNHGLTVSKNISIRNARINPSKTLSNSFVMFGRQYDTNLENIRPITPNDWREILRWMLLQKRTQSTKWMCILPGPRSLDKQIHGLVDSMAVVIRERSGLGVQVAQEGALCPGSDIQKDLNPAKPPELYPPQRYLFEIKIFEGKYRMAHGLSEPQLLATCSIDDEATQYTPHALSLMPIIIRQTQTAYYRRITRPPSEGIQTKQIQNDAALFNIKSYRAFIEEHDPLAMRAAITMQNLETRLRVYNKFSNTFKELPDNPRANARATPRTLVFNMAERAV